MSCLTCDANAKEMMRITSVMIGVSMIMGINTVNSSPSFMLDYYKYIYGDENAVPSNPGAWRNILTIYTLVTQVTQMLLEPTNFTEFLQRFSLTFRLVTSSLLMVAELLIVVIMPHTCHSETAALVGLIMAAFVGGTGRAYFVHAGYALCSLFPSESEPLRDIMFGVAFSSWFVWVMMIFALSMKPYTYTSVLNQSVIYFSISIGLIALTTMLIMMLTVNPYAKRFVAEYRSHRSPLHNIDRPAVRGIVPDPWRSTGASLTIVDVGSPTNVDERAKGSIADSSTSYVSTDAQRGLAPPEEGIVLQLEMATSPQLPQEVCVWSVIDKVYPMMIACFLTFAVTYSVYPGVLIAGNRANGVFMTGTMFLYHAVNFTVFALILRDWRQAPRIAIVIVSVVQIIFIPLLVLCAVQKLTPGTFVTIIVLLCMSHQFVGALTMVKSPETPGLEIDAERIVAGQLTRMCLLAGCAVGSLLQLSIVLGVDWFCDTS